MKVLVIGSGGREHTLVWKLSQSPLVTEIFCAPGNPGIANLAKCVDIEVENIEKLVEFSREMKIEFAIVGPEAPLVLGIVDAFRKEGIKIIGPSKHAARLEGSKSFSKDFMMKYGIPTAKYNEVDNYDEAIAYFTKAIDIDPLFINALCNRGVAFELSKNYGNARKMY